MIMRMSSETDYHIPHGKAIAWCLTPVMAAQEHLCAFEMAELARSCGLAAEEEEEGKAADKLLLNQVRRGF
jgi:alcohol dehydrogenase class IV